MPEHHEQSSTLETIIFNRHEPTQSTLSAEIKVQDRPALITHWNPIPGEQLCLMKFNITDCQEDAGDATFVRECGEFVCMCCERNELKITEPGRYKLYKKGLINNSQVTVRYLSSRYIDPSSEI